MSEQAIRLLIADDNDLFREGLVSLLARFDDISVIAQSRAGEGAVEQSLSEQPDVILMDLMMPGCGGVEATRRIVAETPDAAISMLTVSETDEDLFTAIRAGAAEAKA